MEVSKVTFSRETQFMLNNNPIVKTKNGRAKLRKQRIFEYIRSYPAGTKFSKSDLIAVAGYRPNQYGTGHAFIQRMEKHGELVFEKTEKFKKLVTIPGDTKSYSQSDAPAEENTHVPTPQPEVEDTPKRGAPVQELPPTVDPIDEDKIHDLLFVIKVEGKAKSFAWKTGSDSLREFIKSLK